MWASAAWIVYEPNDLGFWCDAQAVNPLCSEVRPWLHGGVEVRTIVLQQEGRGPVMSEYVSIVGFPPGAPVSSAIKSIQVNANDLR